MQIAVAYSAVPTNRRMSLIIGVNLTGKPLGILAHPSPHTSPTFEGRLPDGLHANAHGNSMAYRNGFFRGFVGIGAADPAMLPCRRRVPRILLTWQCRPAGALQ